MFLKFCSLKVLNRLLPLFPSSVPLVPPPPFCSVSVRLDWFFPILAFIMRQSKYRKGVSPFVNTFQRPSLWRFAFQTPFSLFSPPDFTPLFPMSTLLELFDVTHRLLILEISRIPQRLPSLASFCSALIFDTIRICCIITLTKS